MSNRNPRTRSGFGSTALATAALAALCMTAGCPPQDEPGGDSERNTPQLLAASASNAPVITAAMDTAELMLTDGDDLATIRAALVDQLNGDERVAGVGEDTAAGVVWVDFIDGESHCVLLVDNRTDASGLANLAGDAFAKTVAHAAPVVAADPSKRLARAAPIDTGMRMPGNDTALLVNSLEFIHSNWDVRKTTDVVDKMLVDRGYRVVRGELLLSDFDKLTDYGLILIEAHGTWREPTYPHEVLQILPGQETPGTGNCGGPGTYHSLLTTTQVTEANLGELTKDLLCGRVTIWDVKLLQPNGEVEPFQFYGVTPNYVREHDNGVFPDNTLFLLNACRGIKEDLSSPWRDLLYERSTRGANFLAWTGRVEYAKAARATLYLFQFLTASNEKVEVKGVTVLSDAIPPRGGWLPRLGGALWALELRLYNTDLASGATLDRMVQNAEGYELILAPHLCDITRYDNRRSSLNMYTAGEPVITIGETPVSAGWGGSDWNLTAPVGAYGSVVITESGRNSMPCVLHRWNPKITLTGAVGARQYTVRFTLQARATMDCDSFRSMAWDDAPPAVFETYWDADASFISWTVTGSETVGGKHYTYAGTGQRSFGNRDGGGLRTAPNGTSVELSAYGPITWTTTETSGGSSVTYQDEDTISVSRTGVGLAPNWTVSSASFDQPVGWSGTENISWAPFAANPPFDGTTEPR